MSENLELKQLADDLRGAWEDYKSEHTQALEEAAKIGEEHAETKQTLDRIDSRLDTIEALQTKAAIEGEKRKARDDWRDGETFAAFDKLMRKGPRSLMPDEMKLFTQTDGNGNEIQASLVVSDDTEGGFLAPDEFVNELIKGVVEFSPIRSIARVRTTSRRSVLAPKRTTTAAATWAGEADAAAETTNPKVGQEEISTQELRALTDVSRQDLEDAAFDFEGFLGEEYAEQFGVSEGLAFVSGDGVNGKPEGVLTAADDGYLGANGIETLVSNTNDLLAANDFIDVYFALKDSYAKRATWVMKRSTIKAARKLVDTQNQYLWQPGLAGVAPATILDRPYVEAVDMPAIANGAKAVVFGDFSRYWIVDRLQVETLRDPYTQGPSFVRYWARKRVGGQVVLPEAFKILKIQ